MPGGEEALAGVFTTEQLQPPLIAPLAEAAAGLGAVSPAQGAGAREPVLGVSARAASRRCPWSRSNAMPRRSRKIGGPLLHEAGYPEADRAPSDLARLTDPNALRRYMMDLRKAFGADPGLGATMAERLAGRRAKAPGRRLLAALLDAYRGPDSRYLNFYGAAGRVPTIPLHAVLDAAAEPGSEQPVATLPGASCSSVSRSS